MEAEVSETFVRRIGTLYYTWRTTLRRARSRQLMDDNFLVTCPYCGEELEIWIEPDVHGSFVQDCEVCCNPWLVRVTWDMDERNVNISRADGSE
jgi:hypothetical protein